MCDFGTGDDVCLADSLECVNAMCVLLHNHHDLSERALSDDLHKLKVLNAKCLLAVLNVLDSNLDLARTICDIQPLCARLCKGSLPVRECLSRLLVVLLRRLWILNKLLPLFEAWVDADDTEEDILASAGSWLSVWIANIEVDCELSDARDIELVLCVVTSPQWVLWRSRDGVDEDLDLIEVEECVWEVFRRVSSVVGWDIAEAATGGWWTSLRSSI